jgi:hypothetical protein
MMRSRVMLGGVLIVLSLVVIAAFGTARPFMVEPRTSWQLVP